MVTPLRIATANENRFGHKFKTEENLRGDKTFCRTIVRTERSLIRNRDRKY
jgi:hypothetical protein